MKTVCFFNSTKAWGGGEKWHFDIAVRLSQRQGYRVIVFTNKQSELYDRLKKTDLKVFPVSIANLSFLNPLKVNAIAKILREEKVDTIIMNLSSDMKVAGLAAKKAGVKQIVYRRGLAAPIKDKPLNRYLFNQVITDVICNSKDTYKAVYQYDDNFIDPEKVRIIYNGIDLEEYDSRQSKTVYEREGDEIVIGNAGRLVEQKGQKHLIEIAKHLKQKNLNFKIVIAGKGELREELENMAKEAGVEDCIHFAGFVEDIKGFMQGLDIFVLTSYWEGFGYVLVEAMACAKPVVAFDMTSNPEVVADNDTGYLTEPKQAEPMAECIYQLVDNIDLRQKMGSQGRQRVEEFFDINRTIREVEELIDQAK